MPDIFFIRVKSRSMLVLFHEHKKVGFRKTYKGLTLVFRKEPVNTFAPEKKQASVLLTK